MSQTIFAPNPLTERGYASCFKISPNLKWIAYNVRNSIILRSTSNLISDNKIFTHHSFQTTCVSFHPDNIHAISSDIKGNIILWEIETLKPTKIFKEKFEGGIIKGLCISEDYSRLLIYGESKSVFAKVIFIDDEKPAGELTGNSRNILTGCFRASDRIFLGGEEGIVNCYKDDQLIFHNFSMNKEHNKNFISAMCISPDGKKLITVGFDKKIILYDCDNGKLLETLESLKIENGHKMSIISCSFLTENLLLTSSLDKTNKIWDLNLKKVVCTLKPTEKIELQHMMCGCVSDGKNIFSLLLNGSINVWKIDLKNLVDKNNCDFVINGHQNPITKIIFNYNTNEIISSDINGKILIWPQNDYSQIFDIKDNKIYNMKLSLNNKILFVLLNNGKLFFYDYENKKILFEINDLNGNGPKDLDNSKKNNSTVFVLFSDCVCKVTDGKIEKKEKFNNKFEASAFVVNEGMNEICIGDKKGKIHFMSVDEMKMSDKNLELHTGEITVLKLSPDEKLIASADNLKYIKIWKADSKEIVNDRCDFHSAKIFDLNWSLNSNFLISCSLDYNVIIWKMDDKSKFKEFINVEGDQINSAHFISKDKCDFVCGGNSGAIHKFTI